MITFPYRRICVVGTTGSGKSMLASELARRLQLPYVELDALHWGPNWTHCTDKEMRQHADEATVATPGWWTEITASSAT